MRIFQLPQLRRRLLFRLPDRKLVRKGIGRFAVDQSVLVALAYKRGAFDGRERAGMSQNIDIRELLSKRDTLKPRFDEAADVLGRNDVVRQMRAVLKSHQFHQSSVLRRMLTFLVEESLRKDGSALDARAVAQGVFGAGAEFRSSKDSRVRVAANRLRTALLLYYAYDGIDDDIIIKLEPGNYRPIIERRANR